MNLSGRLRLITEKVPECKVVHDVGTDHAYIPIYLVCNRICEKAVASDVKKGPVKAAMENINKAQLEESIETRLGDGMEPLEVNEADVVIIAGMGGILIKDILDKGITKAKAARLLLLQPMNRLDVVREWLYKNGFIITDEELVKEGDIIYNVISARFTGSSSIPEDTYFYIGKKLLDKRDPLLKNLLQRKIAQLEKAVFEMRSSIDSIETECKYLKLIEVMKGILGELAVTKS